MSWCAACMLWKWSLPRLWNLPLLCPVHRSWLQPRYLFSLYSKSRWFRIVKSPIGVNVSTSDPGVSITPTPDTTTKSSNQQTTFAVSLTKIREVTKTGATISEFNTQGANYTLQVCLSLFSFPVLNIRQNATSTSSQNVLWQLNTTLDNDAILFIKVSSC